MKNHHAFRARAGLAAIALGAGALLAVAAPLSASAHVTVAPNTAKAGGYTLIDVKVPNESATAQTNKVELQLPTDTPFTSVSYVPVAGWTTQLVRETLPKPVTVRGSQVTEAVTKVIWTSTGADSDIQDGQLQVFPLSLGPVPDTDTIVMPALQTYTDGTVVKWVETTADAQHPAPSITVTSDDSGAASASSDLVSRIIGIGGLVIAVVALVIGIAGLRRAER